MPYTVSRCFEVFRRDVVDLDPGDTATARTSRDFVLANITRLSNEGKLPDVMGDYCLNFGSFARNTKIRPLDDIDMMICYDGTCRGRARGTTCSAQIGTGRGAQMGTAYSAQ